MHTPLDNAIRALELAKECGGEEDLPQYASAHRDLVRMREAILAHDMQLTAREKAPDGDDYNRLWSILGLPAAGLDRSRP